MENSFTVSVPWLVIGDRRKKKKKRLGKGRRAIGGAGGLRSEWTED